MGITGKKRREKILSGSFRWTIEKDYFPRGWLTDDQVAREG